MDATYSKTLGCSRYDFKDTYSQQNFIFVLGKFDVLKFEGNISDYVNLYRSYVLKMAKIYLIDRFIHLCENIQFYYGIAPVRFSQQQLTPNITLTSTRLTLLTTILLIMLFSKYASRQATILNAVILWGRNKFDFIK